MKFGVVGKLYREFLTCPRFRFTPFIFLFFSSYERREIIVVSCSIGQKLDSKEEKKKINFRSWRGEIIGFDIVAVVQSYRVQTRGQS